MRMKLTTFLARMFCSPCDSLGNSFFDVSCVSARADVRINYETRKTCGSWTSGVVVCVLCCIVYRFVFQSQTVSGGVKSLSEQDIQAEEASCEIHYSVCHSRENLRQRPKTSQFHGPPQSTILPHPTSHGKTEQPQPHPLRLIADSL